MYQEALAFFRNAARLIERIKRFRRLEGVVKTLLVLNLLDCIFTLFWVQAGLASEKNILLRDLVVEQPVLFAMAKISLVSLGAYLLWTQRRHFVAVCSIFLAATVYVGVLQYHLMFSGVLIARLLAAYL